MPPEELAPTEKATTPNAKNNSQWPNLAPEKYKASISANQTFDVFAFKGSLFLTAEAASTARSHWESINGPQPEIEHWTAKLTHQLFAIQND